MSSRSNLLLPALALLLLGALYLCTRLLDTADAGHLVHGGAGEVGTSEPGGLRPVESEVSGSGDRSGSGRVEIAALPDAPLVDPDAVVEEAPSGPRLFGTVVRAGGVPVPGARVVLRRSQAWLSVPADVEEMSAVWRPGAVHEATCDDEGVFELFGVEPGDVALSISGDGLAPLHRLRLTVPKHEEYDLGRFELELGVRVAGVVNGPRGGGVEGVTVVRAVSPDSGSLRLDLPGHGVPVATTDAEGKFEVASLPPGAWHLIFDHPDYRVTELKGRTEPAGQRESGLFVSLEQGLSIEGRVEGLDVAAEGPLRVTGRRDREQGAGAADAVEGAEKFRPRHAEVRVDGSFELTGLAPGQQYKLRLYKLRKPEAEDPPNLPERWVTVTGVEDARQLAGAKGVVLEYRAEATVRLVARDAGSGRALETFTVSVDGDSLSGGGVLEEEGSDAPRTAFPGGVALYAGLRPGADGASATVRVRADGYVDFEKKGVMLKPGDEVDLGEVTLERAKLVSVRVVRKGTQTPVASAHVVLAKSTDADALERWTGQEEKRAWGDARVRDAFTDAEGRARVTAWPDAICVLAAGAPDYLAGEQERSVPPHEEEVVIELERGGRVTVRIVDDEARPVPGMYVEHTAADRRDGNEYMDWGWDPGGNVENKSNEDGVVVFANLTEGRHEFQALEKKNAWGGGGETSGREAEGEVYLAKGEEKELELRVAARGGYDATLLEAGLPLSGALAQLTSLDSDQAGNGWYWGGEGQEDPRTRISDHTGRVRFQGLKVGRYDLKISHPERRMSIHREVHVTREPRPEVLDLGLAVIEGRVLDPQGEPISGVDIQVQEIGDNDWDGGDYRVRISEDAEGDANWEYEEVKPWSIHTGEDGAYRLRGVRPDVKLQVGLSDRYVVGESRELGPLGRDEYRAGEDFTLERAGAVRVDFSGLVNDNRRRTQVQLVRDVPQGEGVEPRREQHRTSVRPWRPRADFSSVRAGTWTLRVTIDGQEEPLYEGQVEVRVRETQRVRVNL
ncbi:MAG: carboxypeptidase regulatory-like domain-containing protein [Planctomycetes bacterium]|nr:carboxypeptidase regulatory-like domain-containing protein [Planctomycetota bacterium]